jgi:phosphoglycolate phosphatase-like HAD superfamily hydrolase
MKLICFDIDGTLIWTDGAGRRAIHRALVEELGSAGPIATFRFDGRTDGEIVWKLAEGAGAAPDAALIERVLARYVVHLEDELARPGHHTTVFLGVCELLDALERRADCALGLLTGNIAAGARLKLGAAGLAFERFRVGAFGSDAMDRPALPAVAQARARERLGVVPLGHDLVIVGDTPADMRCGEGVGARAIGVGTAAYTPAQLTEAGGYAAFADLTDTAAVVAAIFA